jgi:hypothetical protein
MTTVSMLFGIGDPLRLVASDMLSGPLFVTRTFHCTVPPGSTESLLTVADTPSS